MKKLALIMGLLALSAAACNQRWTRQGVQPSGSSGTASAGQTFDCNGSACPQITIQGDPAFTFPNGTASPFSGFADPSIRKDPLSNRLWMSYSWPNIHVLGQQQFVPSVDIHLASSDDNGATWKSQGPLWPSEPDTNKSGDNGPGYTAHEVSNLLPVQNGSTVTWYGVRQAYFVPQNGGYSKRPGTSFRLEISQASSPAGLSTADYQSLGTNYTAAGWNADINLANLSPDVSKCGFWNETALYYQNNTLYLVTRCLTFNGQMPIENESPNVVFATNAKGSVKQWQWRYVGALNNAQQAKELGGDGLTQPEIAKGQDGQLLAIFTPTEAGATPTDEIHNGCAVVEVASIDPPRLATDSSGRLKVRAFISASDQQPHGPGACTYDPASDTGVIIVRRDIGQGKFITTMNASGIKP